MRIDSAGAIRPPGLWMLELPEGIAGACKAMMGLDAGHVETTVPAVIIASVPLSQDSRWRAFEEGELVVVDCGKVVARDVTIE